MKPKRGLIIALEELSVKPMPVNDTEPLNVDENAQIEKPNKAPKETESSMPTNDTQGLVEKNPADPDPSSTDPVVDLKNLTEKGKETESGISPIEGKKSEVAQESTDGKPMPENDTEPLVQPDPENPHPEGKVVDLKNIVEKGKDAETGIDKISQESNENSMPKNDTQPLVQPDPENPHPEGKVVDMKNLTEKGKDTETGINKIAQEADGAMPKNDTDPLNVEKPLDPNSDGKVVELKELVETGKEVQAGIDIIKGEKEALEEFEAQIDEAQQINDDLERYRDIVENSVETGDMNNTAASILSTAMESLRERAGLPTPKKRFRISLEEHEDTDHRRAQNAKIALEEIQGDSKTLKDKIVAAIKALISQIGQFIKNLMSRAGQIKSASEQFLKAAQDTATKWRTGEFENSSIARGMQVGGKWPAHPIQAATEMLQRASELQKQLVDVGNEALRGLETDQYEGVKPRFAGIQKFDSIDWMGGWKTTSKIDENGVIRVHFEAGGEPESNVCRYLSKEENIQLAQVNIKHSDFTKGGQNDLTKFQVALNNASTKLAQGEQLGDRQRLAFEQLKSAIGAINSLQVHTLHASGAIYNLNRATVFRDGGKQG